MHPLSPFAMLNITLAGDLETALRDKSYVRDNIFTITKLPLVCNAMKHSLFL
jgi:hypothetical protein